MSGEDVFVEEKESAAAVAEDIGQVEKIGSTEIADLQEYDVTKSNIDLKEKQIQRKKILRN